MSCHHPADHTAGPFGVAQKSYLYHHDVEQVMVNARLEKEIYLAVPQGYCCPMGKPGQGLHPQRSLYGLKLASQEWYKLLRKTLSELGLTACDSDLCLHRRNEAKGMVYIFT